eukprot:gene25639-11297_t
MHSSGGGSGGSRGGPFAFLKMIDAYPKVNDDFFSRTVSGGFVTIIASAVMLILFLSEIRLFLTTNIDHKLVVDTARGETITISFDIVFPKMPCAWMSVDTMDISGNMHLDVDHDILKQRLSPKGIPLTEAEKHDVHDTKRVSFDHSDNSSCMSCYGAEDHEGQCCNSCDDVRSAYQHKGWALGAADHVEQCAHDEYLESVKESKGEGCKLWGSLVVNKVAGNFHFAPGRSFQQGGMHIHDIAPFGDAEMDFTHTITKLSFGPDYPGMKNPLDGLRVKSKSQGGKDASGMYQYFVKVVPTLYTSLKAPNKAIHTNQYSVTENFRESSGGMGRSLPGLFVFYDLSPIKVSVSEQKTSFMHFITSVCAIVGGVFTVSGLVDAFVYQSERLIRKKMEMGKQG